MTTALFTHEACHGHVNPEGHPEQVARLHAVLEALSVAEFDGLVRRQAPRASAEEIGRAHPAVYIEQIERATERSGGGPMSLDGADTFICSGSWEAVLRASGAVVGAVDAVMAGDVQNAFCAVRPPGHHAEPEIPMGFCLFNSVAIGAFHALAQDGVDRVAVLDFDVHHGNGTAAMMQNRSDCLFVSSHQMPLYPGTGYREEPGGGSVLNMPLPSGASGDVFRGEWEATAFPALEAFKPDFILVSAGFDGHKNDPLAGHNLEEADYSWITQQIARRADELCGGRMVSTLEGGYDLAALGASAAAHVRELMKA
jgi:acetoin utilization deacetylase AcuC-like enzyme